MNLKKNFVNLKHEMYWLRYNFIWACEIGRTDRGLKFDKNTARCVEAITNYIRNIVRLSESHEKQKKHL